MKYLIKSILAGIMIGIGGTIFLVSSNNIIGAIFFSIGLLMILEYGLNLYTGKIGYIFNNKINYLFEVGITLIGNFIGTFLVGFILKFTRIYEVIYAKATLITTIKVNDTYISIFILSIFCGLLMYLAVNTFKTREGIGKYIAVFICVTVFILSGFEHCIANMYYFTVAWIWNFKTLLYLIIMIAGNSIGSFIIPLSEKIIRKEK